MSAMLKQKLIDIANGFTKYGLWKDTGSSNLSELDDVTLSNLQSNDVLTYNGSKWVNDDNLQKQIDTLNSNLENKLAYYNMSSIDDIREGYSIGFGIINYNGYFSGFFIINISWIHFELMITSSGTYKRTKYGASIWSEWVAF